MNQELVVVYDIRQESVPWGYLLGILVPFGAGVILLLTGLRMAASRRRWVERILRAAPGTAFAVLMTLVGFTGCADYQRALARHDQAVGWLESGSHQIVEGEVTDFHPMPRSGHALEGFTVQGVRFSYSDYDLSEPGFRNTASHGGPIREGLYVRIAHQGGRILKLEVRK